MLEHNLKSAEPDEVMSHWDLYGTDKISRCESTCRQAKQDVFLEEAL